jgi:hypothetical protein
MQKHGVIIIKNHTGNFVERYSYNCLHFSAPGLCISLAFKLTVFVHGPGAEKCKQL